MSSILRKFANHPDVAEAGEAAYAAELDSSGDADKAASVSLEARIAKAKELAGIKPEEDPDA